MMTVSPKSTGQGRDASGLSLGSAVARDKLTGLASIAQARQTIEGWRANAAKRDAQFTMHAMLVSLQRIDTINVAFGETAGDGALIEVARRITHFADDEFAASGWLAARVSGGTFLIASLERCSRERWQWLAEALADAIALPVSNVVGEGTVRLWPRVTLMRSVDLDTDALLDRMASAFAEKFDGNARRIAWVSDDAPIHNRSSTRLEADLIAALDRDEIEIVFQPQFSVAGDRPIGAEALARWQHPELGLVGASTLFTIAERADHVAQLSRHISEKALRLACKWPQPMRLSLNITPTDLSSGNFARDFLAMIEEAGCKTNNITVEITEQLLLTDLVQTTETLEAIKAEGVSLALDDFGAGFCNFRYLKVLPLDYIKLDGTMIENIENDERDLSVFRAIVAMAKALELKIVAEGVESEEQRRIIAREKCDFYQGFLKSEPLRPERFMDLIGK